MLDKTLLNDLALFKMQSSDTQSNDVQHKSEEFELLDFYCQKVIQIV